MKQIPEYIDVYDLYKADIARLVDEFSTVSSLLEVQKRLDTTTIYHKSLTLYKLGREHELLQSLPYTKKVVYDLLKVRDHNVVTYRCVLPHTCYSWHKDGTDACLHIPIITNDGSRFVYEDKAIHMPADGSVYLVNNLRYHSFMNGGGTQRVHLTFEKL